MVRGINSDRLRIEKTACVIHWIIASLILPALTIADRSTTNILSLLRGILSDIERGLRTVLRLVAFPLTLTLACMLLLVLSRRGSTQNEV